MAVDPAVDAQVSAGVGHAVLSSIQGHAFLMESQRHAALAGVISSREAQSLRTVSESGSGQMRAMLPAGYGGNPSTPPPTTGS